MPLPFVLFMRLSLRIFVSASPYNAKLSAFIIVVLPVPFLLPSPPKSKLCPNTSVSESVSKLTAWVLLPTLIKFFAVTFLIFNIILQCSYKFQSVFLFQQ